MADLVFFRTLHPIFVTLSIHSLNDSTVSRTFDILDHEFNVDELATLSITVCPGVSGFIYTRECVELFDENDDEIQDYLSDWVFDNIGKERVLSSISLLNAKTLVNSRTNLCGLIRTQSPWHFVREWCRVLTLSYTNCSSCDSLCFPSLFTMSCWLCSWPLGGVWQHYWRSRLL